MSGLVFWVYGLCMDLFFGLWTCVCCVWTCVFGGWTCFWGYGFAFSVYGLVLFVSALVFLVYGLVFVWCLDLFLGVCVLVGCDYGVCIS